MLTIKNNNLYYYNYLITDKQLSLFLVPIGLLIILNKNYIKYFSYIFFYIAVIGTLDTIYKFTKHKLYFILVSTLIFHLVLLYPIINFKKYFKPRLFHIIITLLALLIIYYLPFWPYYLSKKIFAFVLIISHLLLYFLYINFYNNYIYY